MSLGAAAEAEETSVTIQCTGRDIKTSVPSAPEVEGSARWCSAGEEREDEGASAVEPLAWEEEAEEPRTPGAGMGSSPLL